MQQGPYSAALSCVSLLSRRTVCIRLFGLSAAGFRSMLSSSFITRKQHKDTKYTHTGLLLMPVQTNRGKQCRLGYHKQANGILVIAATHGREITYLQETQLKLAVADRTKPEVEIWRQPQKINFLTPVSYSLLQTVFR